MADCASYEDGMRAQKLGFDIVGTTLVVIRRYQRYRNSVLSNVRKAGTGFDNSADCRGGIWEPQQLQKAFACGAYAAVIGTAITRPREITKRFVNAITK